MKKTHPLVPRPKSRALLLLTFDWQELVPRPHVDAKGAGEWSLCLGHCFPETSLPLGGGACIWGSASWSLYPRGRHLPMLQRVNRDCHGPPV